ncbi:hypothetical protein CVT24_003362 [Panaeolus cyanescens]|uniref:Glycoside hydrolase family 5 domain-containing protein n=1 Tax=Panaeolus cyanescens TaxID=181874 RepID=A0A409Y779_9AGAR|nr:hypothetical protein CVT24_003362 [Panaeolus cyanescens]
MANFFKLSALLTITLSATLALPATPLHGGITHKRQLSDECQVEPYNETVAEQNFDAFDQSIADVYRYRQQRSVNLGSWFVHENWLTPSLFTCASEPKVSELDIAIGWGSQDSARALLERHWDTFITADDFKYLADKGINTVRLPIGYWSLGPDFLNGTIFEPVSSVYKSSWNRVLRAIKQAAEHGLGVLVDLHAAPGSQNGSEHSGVSDGTIGLFNDPFNIQKTMEMLEFITKQVAGINNVVGLQILNEPQYTDSLEEFYNQAIDAVRNATPLAKTLPLYLHDGFNLGRLAEYVSKRQDFVVQDHHAYFVFGDAGSKSASDHTNDIVNQMSSALSDVASRQRGNLVVGEWSCALTPQSLEKEEDAEAAQKAFCEQQLNVYTNVTSGWAFWTFTKEGCEGDLGWCFKAALGKTLPSTFSSTQDSETSRLSTRLTKTLRSLFHPSSNIPHRFSATQMRRQTIASFDTDTEDESRIQGYSDGLDVAQTFAAARSTLGFVEQYILDHMPPGAELVVSEETRGHYSDGFLMGLKDGQAQ